MDKKVSQFSMLISKEEFGKAVADCRVGRVTPDIHDQRDLGRHLPYASMVFKAVVDLEYRKELPARRNEGVSLFSACQEHIPETVKEVCKG